MELANKSGSFCTKTFSYL